MQRHDIYVVMLINDVSKLVLNQDVLYNVDGLIIVFKIAMAKDAQNIVLETPFASSIAIAMQHVRR